MTRQTILYHHVATQPGGGGTGLVYEAGDLNLRRRVELNRVEEFGQKVPGGEK